MPFVPYGKKSKKRHAKREAEERVIDEVVTRAQFATQRRPHLCLPVCVLVERVLAKRLPSYGFALRLGALNVIPATARAKPISFDPRNDGGAERQSGRLPPDTPFHAWLESRGGELLDPSVLLTLEAEGYDVDPMEYFLGGGRRFTREGLHFVYEELPQMELLGLAESEPHLVLAESFVTTGEPHPMLLGSNVLDVGWRA